MHDVFLIGSASFIGVADAVIFALPMIACFRRHRRRSVLMGAFLHAAHDNQLRAKFRRQEAIFSDGFIDSFTGTAGLLRFRLTRRFRPFAKIDVYGLKLGHGDAEVGSGREWFELRTETPKTGGPPIVRIYRELRKKYPMGASLSEAS